jgi:SAP domain-containing new25
MSNTLKSKKKPELQALAAELGIDTDGSKSDLEARILLHLSSHVELKGDSKFSKYFASITGPESPGPVASVAQGTHRRRSIAVKKSTDLGETASKALTRCVISHLLALGN